MIRRFLLSLLVVAQPTLALADVITFESVPPGIFYTVPGFNTIVDGNFQIVVSGDPYTARGVVGVGAGFCSPTPCSNNGTNALYTFSATFTLSRTDGGAFNLLSLDAATFFTGINDTLNVYLVGDGASSPTAHLTSLAGGADAFQTFSLTGFENLHDVKIYQPANATGGYSGFAIDNLVATIPEPSTWAMMIVGFAGLGFIARHRKSKTALIAA
jgi:hypothetical protein